MYHPEPNVYQTYFFEDPYGSKEGIPDKVALMILLQKPLFTFKEGGGILYKPFKLSTYLQMEDDLTILLSRCTSVVPEVYMGQVNFRPNGDVHGCPYVYSRIPNSIQVEELNLYSNEKINFNLQTPYRERPYFISHSTTY